jgi:hypothetical protein
VEYSRGPMISSIDALSSISIGPSLYPDPNTTAPHSE